MAGEKDQNRQIHATVKGRVQGVGFRHFTTQQATDCGVTGYVRNLHNGDVEVLAEGHEGDLRSFIDALRQGPRSARVEDVKVDWGQPTGEYSRFRVTY
jgi:acylphosphatase